MDVHVPEAGDEEQPPAVDDRGRVAGITGFLSRTDGGDAVFLDDDNLIGANFASAHVHDVDVGNDGGVLQRPVLRGQRQGRDCGKKERKERGAAERGTHELDSSVDGCRKA
jgi:hypothetical protein